MEQKVSVVTLRDMIAKIIFDTIPARSGSSSEASDDWVEAYYSADAILDLIKEQM